jgi:hypothetical protein
MAFRLLREDYLIRCGTRSGIHPGGRRADFDAILQERQERMWDSESLAQGFTNKRCLGVNQAVFSGIFLPADASGKETFSK